MRKTFGLTATALVLALSQPALLLPSTAMAQSATRPAAAAPGVAPAPLIRMGMLRCNVAGDVAFVFGSTRALICDFTPTQGASERYTGEIDRYGIDIGFRQSGVMLWAVAAGGQGVPRGALAGRYGGVSADVAIGVGGGVNVLSGGNPGGYALQPISIDGDVGLNIGAGIAVMTLRSAG